MIVSLGLEYHNLVSRKVTELKNTYINFNDQERSLITLYIFWLFTFGQYARFWKGPGHPYHVERMNFAYLPVERQRPEFCTPYHRDVLSNIQQVIYKTILYNLSLLPNSEATISWVKNLPVVRYNIELDEAVISASNEITNIDSILRKAENGQLCMMFTSDSTIETSFFLARRVLGIGSTDMFNAELRRILPVLRNLERDIVASKIEEAMVPIRNIIEQLQSLDPHDPTSEARRRALTDDLDAANGNPQLLALQEQLDRLSVEPMPIQEDFNPGLRRVTGEGDPGQHMIQLD